MNLLQRTGEEFVKIARLEGNYIDHTGNLRSSIGYVIVKDGRIVGKNFQLSEKEGTILKYITVIFLSVFS